jgi:hypothetical protein
MLPRVHAGHCADGDRSATGVRAAALLEDPAHITRTPHFICVSTGGRILGLGDIGATGTGIAIGKLRADPFYLGVRDKPPAAHEIGCAALVGDACRPRHVCCESDGREDVEVVGPARMECFAV